jgi:hypothetical protein
MSHSFCQPLVSFNQNEVFKVSVIQSGALMRHNHITKPAVLNSLSTAALAGSMDDNHDTYKTANIKINQLF